MLVQHFMTERLFERVFRNQDCVRRNIVASEVEKVIDALKDGASDHDAVAKATGLTFDAFEAQWKASLAKRPEPKLLV